MHQTSNDYANKACRDSLARSNIYKNGGTKAASRYEKPERRDASSRGSRYHRDDQNDRKVASEPAKSADSG